MPDYATAVPLRSLTDEQREAIKYFLYTTLICRAFFCRYFYPLRYAFLSAVCFSALFMPL